MATTTYSAGDCINLEDVDCIKWIDGQVNADVECLYLGADLLWIQILEVSSETIEAEFFDENNNPNITINAGCYDTCYTTSSDNCGYYVQTFSGVASCRNLDFMWIELPKPTELTLSANQSCAVKINWDTSVDITTGTQGTSEETSANNLSFGTTRTLLSYITNLNVNHAVKPTDVYSDVADSSQWYHGTLTSYGWEFIGAMFNFPPAHVDYWWNYTSGGQNRTATGKVTFFGFYDYTNDRPCIGLLGDKLGWDVTNDRGEMKHINRTSNAGWYNWASMRPLLTSILSVELIPGQHDPMWPHSKWGVVQRNPKRGVITLP
jgi:hypothetical protein